MSLLIKQKIVFKENKIIWSQLKVNIEKHSLACDDLKEHYLSRDMIRTLSQNIFSEQSSNSDNWKILDNWWIKHVDEKNKPIENKKPNNSKKESVFKFDIVKDRRFTKDQFSFHAPVKSIKGSFSLYRLFLQ